MVCFGGIFAVKILAIFMYVSHLFFYDKFALCPTETIEICYRAHIWKTAMLGELFESGKLRELEGILCNFSENCDKQNSVTRCGFCGAKML